MIVTFTALVAGISAALAQEQERKLVDRVLRPNMSLVNSAQNKQFTATSVSVTKRMPAKSFYIANKSLGKSFAAGGVLSPRRFATRRLKARDASVNIAARSQLTRTDGASLASATYGTRVAPENGDHLTATPFAGSRPFLGRGKSQKALSDRDTPLSIEQVRELLNKNK